MPNKQHVVSMQYLHAPSTPQSILSHYTMESSRQEESARLYHPLFDSPDADVVLRSVEGTLYRVPSFTLRNTSGFFRTMLSLPQGNEAQQEVVIPVNENDKALGRLLRMISGLETPKWESYAEVEEVIALGETWDVPGPLATIRSAITSPFFLEDPLHLYAIATHFGWEDEAKIASKYTLSLSLHDEQHQVLLQRLPSKHLLKLLSFHRQRRDEFKRLVDSEESFKDGNSNPCRCPSCGEEADNHTWRELKSRMFLEMDRRPLGDTLWGLEMEEWPEAVACWGAKCAKDDCGKARYAKTSMLRDIRRCIDKLPLTI